MSWLIILNTQTKYFIAASGCRVLKEGTGPGLAICKEFIEAQEGHIWMESALGQGTIFGFELPVV
jgi:signal transduction histidine kinase